MEEIFKDWSTYIIGLPTLIISILMSFYLFKRQSKIKNLGFITVLNYNFFDIKEIVRDKISITYNKEKAENLKIVIIRIINTGNTPILKQDFESSIQILFEKKVKFIDIDIVKKYPNNIDLVLKTDLNKIFINPCLINPKDFFEIQILLNCPSAKFSIDSRIAGIDGIEEIKTNESFKALNTTTYILIGMSILIMIQMIYSYISDQLFKTVDKDVFHMIIVIFVSIMIVLMPIILWVGIDRYKTTANKKYSAFGG